MNWIFDNLGLIVFIFIAISVVRKVKAFWQRVESDAERRAARSRPEVRGQDPDEARRVREIQDEIRRKIAERRGGATPPPVMAPTPFEEDPPMLPPTRTPPVDPYDSPMKRAMEQLERRLQPTPPPAYQESRSANAAQVARQEELAEQMRVLEESRMLAERRAAQARAALTREYDSERGVLTASRGSLLAELHDPRSLRRAFVLREVLGPPPSLR
jgi:hypothetical protein